MNHWDLLGQVDPPTTVTTQMTWANWDGGTSTFTVQANGVWSMAVNSGLPLGNDVSEMASLDAAEAQRRAGTNGGTNGTPSSDVTLVLPKLVVTGTKGDNVGDLINQAAFDLYGHGAFQQGPINTFDLYPTPSIQSSVASNTTATTQQVAIIINGSTSHPLQPRGTGLTSSGNPLGHVAVAVQGRGVFSYGNDTPIGSSTTDYLTAQAAKRDTTVFVLDVNSQQAQGTADFFSQNPNIPVTLWDENCVVISNKGLQAGNINLRQFTSGSGPNGQIAVPVGHLPSDMNDGATNYINYGGSGYYITIPKGSTVPRTL